MVDFRSSVDIAGYFSLKLFLGMVYAVNMAMLLAIN